MSEANRQLMRDWFQKVWNQRDESAIDQMFAADCVAHNFPETGGSFVGPEGFKPVYRNFCGAFPDLHVTVEEVIAEGDCVAAHFTTTMTHLGDHLGIAASGRKAKLPGAAFARVKNGKFTETWNFIDMEHLFRQLRSTDKQV
jgi:steroid delta-isomerase-like uncharacterized protein